MEWMQKGMKARQQRYVLAKAELTKSKARILKAFMVAEMR